VKSLDRILLRWRIGKASAWLPAEARVLDIGCHQGEFFQLNRDRIRWGVGIDPVAVPVTTDRWELRAFRFETTLPFEDGSFDAIVSLATLEHLDEHSEVAFECYRALAPGGRVILTVPEPAVDHIVDLLVRLRMADGMALEEHHGFEPSILPRVFGAAGFELEHHGRFQLGLNNVYVFRRPSA